MCQAEVFDSKEDKEDQKDANQPLPDPLNIAELAADLEEIEWTEKHQSVSEQEKTSATTPKPRATAAPDVNDFAIINHKPKRSWRPDIEKLKESDIFRRMLQHYPTLRDRNLPQKLKRLISSSSEVLKNRE